MADSRFVLVRHALTDAVGKALSGRTPDVALNAEGLAQTSRLAVALRGKAFTAILSSPQLRAWQTAEAIASGAPVHAEPALDEIDFGPWTGQAFAALDGRSDWARWNTQRSLAPAPGVETMLQVQARAAALFTRLHADAPGTYLLVSHADVLKALLAQMLGMPIDLMQRLDVAPASRSSIVLHEGGVTVEFINLQA